MLHSNLSSRRKNQRRNNGNLAQNAASTIESIYSNGSQTRGVVSQKKGLSHVRIRRLEEKTKQWDRKSRDSQLFNSIISRLNPSTVKNSVQASLDFSQLGSISPKQYKRKSRKSNKTGLSMDKGAMNKTSNFAPQGVSLIDNSLNITIYNNAAITGHQK